MTDVNAIRQELSSHGQEHLLGFYDELTPQQRQTLLQQIESLDLDQLDELIETHVLNKPEVRLPEDIEPPPMVPALPKDDQSQREKDQARERGEQLIAAGKVAAFVVAGGQGTRLGYDGPKGCLEATPVAHKPLFQVFAEQILAAGRRAGVRIPWYIMTSPANDVVTRAFFRQHKYFGLEPEDVFFLVQGQMPSFDFDGKILLAEKDRLALSPNGHGGSLQAMRDSGALDDMAKRGIEYISYFQVDNPLVHCIDPVFIGLHEMRSAEMSAKAVSKRDPLEKLGNFCLIDGRVHVIEYSDLSEEMARQTTDDGRLRFRAGSIAIHLFSRSFVERLTEGGRCELPCHRAEKAVAYMDAEGNKVEPAEPNAVKLEMFVFDAMPLAKEAVILETLRDKEFSPVKNASGEDSLTTALHDQVRRAAELLEAAGVSVPRDADGKVAAALEISPLYAENIEDLKQKIDPNLEIPPGDSLYLGSRGQTGGLKGAG